MRHKNIHTTLQPMHKQQRLKSLRMSKCSGQFCLHPLSKDLQPAGVPTFFLESISVQQVNITDQLKVNQTHVRQTQRGGSIQSTLAPISTTPNYGQFDMSQNSKGQTCGQPCALANKPRVGGIFQGLTRLIPSPLSLQL